MRMQTYWLILFALTAMLANGCATQVATSGRIVLQEESSTNTTRFSNQDRKIIHDYYATHKAYASENAPPRLVKREVLPPGVQADMLPTELRARLTRLPDNYVRMRVGTDVVLLDRSNRVVLDVIYGVAE
jgi:hypothetical protein